MAKLLDLNALGRRPTPQTPTGVAGFRPQTGEGEIAEAMVDLGGTIARIGEELTRARRASQLAESVSLATRDLNQLEFSLQQDPDFKTAPQRFAQSAESIQKRYEESIDDGVVKETFRRRMRELTQTKNINVLQLTAKKEGDHNVAVLDQSLDTYAHAAADVVNPAEREVILNQAQLAITEMQQGGWITAVDAGDREREFLGKLDQATVIRDMAMDPMGTAEKLTDPEYVPNLDPVQRERWIDQGFRRAEAERTRQEREAEKEQDKRNDEVLKEAFHMLDTGTLTHDYVESIRPNLDPTEYRSLLKELRGGAEEDDILAIEDLESLIYNDPAAARSLAFQYHRDGRIQSGTLQKYNALARTVSRAEGPRSPYERERAYISDALKPSPMTRDPAPHARMAQALREFDDFALEGDHTPKVLREKASEIVKDLSIINMEELARRTGLGYRTGPEAQIEQIRNEMESVQQDFQAGRIDEDEYLRLLAELNQARQAAEAARETTER